MISLDSLAEKPQGKDTGENESRCVQIEDIRQDIENCISKQQDVIHHLPPIQERTE